MTEHFCLRVAEPKDSLAVSSLLEASYTKLLVIGYEPELMARALPLMTKANPQLLASGNFYVVQSQPGHLIGCGGWSKERPGSGEIRHGEAHIRHFATHPDWTRRGIGRALLARCLQDTKAAATRLLECYSSLMAVDFYRASEFVAVRTIDMQLTSDVSIPGVLMRREFSQ